MKKHRENTEAMDIVYVPIKDLNPAAYNPRKLTKKQGDDIRQSLDRFGFVDPVIVNSNPERHNVIIGGHQRVKIWELMGNETVPVFYVSLDESSEKELNVRLNKNSGEWDWDILANEFDTEDLKSWGFEDFDFQITTELPPEETSGDDEVQEVSSPITVAGDVYHLGQHRLVCGDSTIQSAVDLLCGEDKGLADMIFTDPPYGVAYVGKTKDSLTIDNDELGDEGTRELVRDILTIAPLKPGGVFYVCSPSGNTETFFRLAIQDSGLMLKQCIVWVKNAFVLGHQDYHYRHESILTGWKDGASHYFIKDRKQDTVWEFPRPNANKDHPTMKPVDLVAKAIFNSSKPGQTVYEPCGGSGTTLIACEKLGRKALVMEIDPKYCDVIVRRYVKFCRENNREYTVIRNGDPCDDFE
jgi:DNA modification methylase